MREIKYKAHNKRTKETEIITDLYWFEENGVHNNGDNDWEFYDLNIEAIIDEIIEAGKKKYYKKPEKYDDNFNWGRFEGMMAALTELKNRLRIK